jgi:hypothetical protein
MIRKSSLLALVVALAVGGYALAATTAPVTITVTVEYLAVSVDPTWAIGTVAVSSSSQNNAALVITNGGNLAEDFSLAQTKAANWTVGTAIADVGADKYVLAARLVVAKPAGGAFVDNDVVTEVTQWCDGTTKFGNGGSNIAASGTQNMWLLFKAPTSTGTGTQQTITLTVGCKKH